MQKSYRVSQDQISLMTALLDAMQDEGDWITEQQAQDISQSKRHIGVLVKRGILQKAVMESGPNGRRVSYRFTDDGRTVAKGLVALDKIEKEHA